jgi:outer membrane lipoprotein SlyB
MNKLVAVVMAALWLSGCASYGGWQPTIDPRADANKETVDRDLVECKELASKASGGTATEAAKGTAVGAVGGAAVGAIIGAVSGSAGTGAALGAAIGGTGGAATQGVSAEQQYKHSYIKCLQGRGHRVIN